MLGEPNAQCSWEGRRFKLLEHALHAHNHKVSAGIDHTVYWNETDPEEETLVRLKVVIVFGISLQGLYFVNLNDKGV